MTEPHPPIRLILDTFALRAYAAGSMDAGEPVQQAVENGACVGVTAVAAAEALAHIDDLYDQANLHRLFNSDTCIVLDTYGEDWPQLAYWLRDTGRIDLATCVLAVVEHGGWILTGEPQAYGVGVPIIDMTAEG